MNIICPSMKEWVIGDQVKVIAWYDNEYGYVARLVMFTNKVVASL